MGMYTELVMNVELKSSMPDNVLAVIRAMAEGEGDTLNRGILPSHPLFSADRWTYMLRSGSFYFVPTSATILIENFSDTDHPTRHLSVRTDLKNYDNEIDLFADWIAPYIEDGGFAGYKRYEEDEHPTLLYFEGGKAIWRAANAA